MKIGEKIKKARLELGLTQGQLAGDAISRDMLSKIETGAAKPSLKTLEYLAERLNLPAAYLCGDNLEIGLFEKETVICEIYEAYASKKYSSCINRAKRLSSTDNELAYILTECYFREGISALRRGSLSTAKSSFSSSLDYSKKTVLDTSHITLKIPMYLAICSNISSPLLEFDPIDVENGLLNNLDYEYLKYLSLDFDFRYKNQALFEHIEAKKDIKARDYHKAISRLNTALDFVRGTEYDAYTVFGIYSDLETCYKQLSDYEKAYSYASKKLSLIEGFKS